MLSLVVACTADNLPVTPQIASVGREASSLGETGPAAWSWPGVARTSPMLTQPYATSIAQFDMSLYRQVWAPASIGGNEEVLLRAWAGAHRGHLYIIGDEEDKDASWGQDSLSKIGDYVTAYCNFLQAVRDSDATAKFAPGGFSHEDVGNGYKNAFVSAYSSGPCRDVPIEEWSFHKGGTWSAGLGAFLEYVDAMATWADNHGAPMVLGAWTLDNTGAIADDDVEYLERLQAAKEWLASHSGIRLTRYQLFEPWGPEPHPLADSNGSLTLTGKVLATNPQALTSVQIWGNSQVAAYGACEWLVTVGSGNSPYSYLWRFNGQRVGSNSSALYYGNNGSDFTLSVTVVDADGRMGTASKTVSISPGAYCE